MFEDQQSFSAAIAGLLLEVGARPLAPMMPDKCARRERDPLPRLLQPPAKVHVIAGRAKYVVEAVDFQECFAAKRHVATRDMLGPLITFQNVCRLAGAGCDACGEPTVLWRQIWSADGRCSAPLELVYQVRQP